MTNRSSTALIIIIALMASLGYAATELARRSEIDVMRLKQRVHELETSQSSFSLSAGSSYSVSTSTQDGYIFVEKEKDHTRGSTTINYYNKNSSELIVRIDWDWYIGRIDVTRQHGRGGFIIDLDADCSDEFAIQKDGFPEYPAKGLLINGHLFPFPEPRRVRCVHDMRTFPEPLGEPSYDGTKNLLSFMLPWGERVVIDLLKLDPSKPKPEGITILPK